MGYIALKEIFMMDNIDLPTQKRYWPLIVRHGTRAQSDSTVGLELWSRCRESTGNRYLLANTNRRKPLSIWAGRAMRASTDCFLDFVQLGIRTRLGFVMHIDQTSYPAHNKMGPLRCRFIPTKSHFHDVALVVVVSNGQAFGHRIGVELGDVSRTSAPTFDYVIVGGGTAGCCLTSRLSEDPDVTVLLIERGSVAETWASGVPLISSDIFKKDSIARPLNSLPQLHADLRVIPLMRGQALGGTSCVNAMIYTRGVLADFNRWRDMCHPDWSYEKMLPFFVKSENTLSHPESTFRGKNGPWEDQTFSHTTWPILP